MNCSISIIHGARRIGVPKGLKPDWLGNFKRHLEKKGYASVEPFYWSGDVKDAFKQKLAIQYAEHLQTLINKNKTLDSRQICIIAKSLGAIVAERAINYLYLENKLNMKIPVFLRVAVPDIRKTISVFSVDRIINVKSKSDNLYKLALIPASLIINAICPNRRPQMIDQTYILDNFSHADLNKNLTINIPNVFKGKLYDFYHHILKENITNNSMH